MTTASEPYHAPYTHCDACGEIVGVTDAPVECAACRPPDLLADVREFHERFGVSYEGKPRTLPESLREFRTKFLEEECREYDEAARETAERLSKLNPSTVTPLLAEQLDALVDLVYVALGNAVMQGFDFNEAWRRVHRANMAKRRAAADGSDSRRGNVADVVKPPGWVAPDHSDLVADHAHLSETAP